MKESDVLELNECLQEKMNSMGKRYGFESYMVYIDFPNKKDGLLSVYGMDSVSLALVLYNGIKSISESQAVDMQELLSVCCVKSMNEYTTSDVSKKVNERRAREKGKDGR